MIINTNKGKIKLHNFIGTMEGLPELSFDCEIVSEELEKEMEEKLLANKQESFSLMEEDFKGMGYGSLEQLEAANPAEEYCYVIFYMSKASDRITARIEKGGADSGELLEYYADFVYVLCKVHLHLFHFFV